MPWHFVFESLAYAIAFRLYLRARNRSGDFLDSGTRWTVIVAAVAGAAIGSKLLYLFEDPGLTRSHLTDVRYLLGGKTIVGALLGGTLLVELVKRKSGIQRRTGDLFAIPICVGIAVGRVGCFLAGKADDTYGIPSSLPWAMDLGDGIRRHPVQLYEIVAMLALAMLLRRVNPPQFAEGDRFRLFVFTYYAWRLLIDFLKPGVRLDGLTTLQWVCLAAALWYAQDVLRILRARSIAPQEQPAHV